MAGNGSLEVHPGAASPPLGMPSRAGSGADRIRARLAGDRLGIVAYVPVGDPLLNGEELLDTYSDAGVAVLEIGMPNGDPYLDGPEVGSSMQRAHAAGVTPQTIAGSIGRWRSNRVGHVPAIVWMGYPDLEFEAVEFAASVGAIDGLLIVDETLRGDAPVLAERLDRLGVAHCAFVSWEATADELRVASHATGYVMVQARPGPTGTGNRPEVPGRQVELVRERAPAVPVVAGFGIQDPPSLRHVAEAGVDGVVVGSACVKALGEGGAGALRRLLTSLVDETAALDAAAG